MEFEIWDKHSWILSEHQVPFLNNTVIVTTDFHVMIRFRSKTLMINNRLCSPSTALLFLSLFLSKLENKIPNTISITFLLTDAEKQVFLHSEKLGNKLRRICRVTDYLQNQNILYCRSSQVLKIFAVKFALFIDYYFLQNEKQNNFMTEERQNTVTVTVIEINKEDLGVLHIFSS